MTFQKNCAIPAKKMSHALQRQIFDGCYGAWSSCDKNKMSKAFKRASALRSNDSGSFDRALISYAKEIFESSCDAVSKFNVVLPLIEFYEKKCVSSHVLTSFIEYLEKKPSVNSQMIAASFRHGLNRREFFEKDEHLRNYYTIFDTEEEVHQERISQ